MIDPDTLTPDERTRLLRALRALPPATPLHRIRWDTVLMALRSGGEPFDPQNGTVGALLERIDAAEARRAAEAATNIETLRRQWRARFAEMAERLDPTGQLRRTIKEERAALGRRECERRDAAFLADIKRRLEQDQRRRAQLPPWPRA